MNNPLNLGGIYTQIQQTDSVPDSWMMSETIKPIISKLVHKKVITSSGVPQLGSSALFNIPTGNSDFLRSNSVYLRGTVNIPCTNSTAGVGYFNNWAGSASTPTSGSASALIDRLTVSCNSCVIESINNYGSYLCPLVYNHCCSTDYQTTLKNVEWVGSTDIIIGSADTSVNIPFCIPLLSGFLCNGSKDIPLALMNNSGLQIQVDFQSIFSKVFVSSVSTVAFPSGNFTVNNLELCYEAIQLEQSYLQALRQQLQNKLYQIPCKSFQISNYAGSGTINQMLSSNFGSLNSVLWSFLPTPAANSKQVSKSTLVSLFEVYVNGSLENQYSLNTDTNVCSLFLEMRKAISNSIGDCSVNSVNSSIIRTTGGALNAMTGTFLSEAFTSALNLQSTNENGFFGTGMPCNNLIVKVTSAAQAADILYIALNYSMIISVDEFGNVSKSM